MSRYSSGETYSKMLEWDVRMAVNSRSHGGTRPAPSDKLIAELRRRARFFDRIHSGKCNLQHQLFREWGRRSQENLLDFVFRFYDMYGADHPFKKTPRRKYR